MRLQDSCQSSSYQAKCSWTLDDPIVAWSALLFRGVTGKASHLPSVTQLGGAGWGFGLRLVCEKLKQWPHFLPSVLGIPFVD